MIDEDTVQAQGGRARALSLSPERRKEIAKEAANARWGRPRQEVIIPRIDPIVLSLSGCTTNAVLELTAALGQAGFYLIAVVEKGCLKSGIVPKDWAG